MQAADSELLLYLDDTCLVFQQKDRYLNQDFSTLIDWFIDSKLSIHFGVEKTKSILFSPKHILKTIGQ